MAARQDSGWLLSQPSVVAACRVIFGKIAGAHETCRNLTKCSPEGAGPSTGVIFQPGLQVRWPAEVEQRLGQGFHCSSGSAWMEALVASLRGAQRRLSWRRVTAAASAARPRASP